MDLYYAGPVQPLTTAGEELDHLDQHLPDLSVRGMHALTCAPGTVPCLPCQRQSSVVCTTAAATLPTATFDDEPSRSGARLNTTDNININIKISMIPYLSA